VEFYFRKLDITACTASTYLELVVSMGTLGARVVMSDLSSLVKSNQTLQRIAAFRVSLIRGNMCCRCLYYALEPNHITSSMFYDDEVVHSENVIIAFSDQARLYDSKNITAIKRRAF
jgi:hypothetical protein